MGNCGVRFTYAANDDRTARRVSDLLGQATETKIQKSRSGTGLWLSSRTESEQEYGRPLLTAGEVGQLSQDEGLLLVGGLLPYRGRKVRYYLDPRFRDRAGLPAPDRPEEQALELLPRRRSEWEGLMVPVVSERQAGSETDAGVAAWADFFEGGEPPVDGTEEPVPSDAGEEHAPTVLLAVRSADWVEEDGEKGESGE